MPKTQVLIRTPRVERLWGAAQLVALVALVVVLVLLIQAPARGLAVVWGGAIPLVALSLFVTPVAWRGVCPLATLNEVGNRFRVAAPPSPGVQRILGVAGLLLFHLLVPARLLWFNHSGPAVAAAALAIGLLAIGLGARFAVRSGFCNSLCPILPVERLYGQAPLISLDRARCGACTVCTPRGCLDLSGTKSLPQVLGPSRRTADWLGTPFGIFSAGLPGFIVGYFLAPDRPSDPIHAYGYTLTGSLLSYSLTAGGVLLTNRSVSSALPVIAALAGAIYFGFTGPAIARLWHLPSPAGLVLSGGLVLFVGWWLTRALRATR